MLTAILIGILGLFLGSFLYAIALRYDPDRFVLAPVSRGRSQCAHCRRDLRWFELVPLVSFVFQGGRCRSCKTRIGWRYPASELATGVIFFLVAWRLVVVTHPFGVVAPVGPDLLVLWLAAAALLILASFIDLRLRLIPDEIVVALAAIGIAVTALSVPFFGATGGSFLGSYALLFGLRGSLWVNHLAGAVFGAAFFGGLFAVTRGRGIGEGDLKLGAALGLLFGWPDIVLIVFLSFILGTLVFGPLLVARRLGGKSIVAFGPFIALAALVVFVWGGTLMHAYFSLFGIV